MNTLQFVCPFIVDENGVFSSFPAIMNNAEINISLTSFGENGCKCQLEFYLGVKSPGN